METNQYGDKTAALMEFLESRGPMMASELKGIQGLPVRIDATLARLTQAGLLVEAEPEPGRRPGKRAGRTYAAVPGWRATKKEVEFSRRRQARALGSVGRPLAEPSNSVSMRLTESQRMKFFAAGGAKWVKRLLDGIAT